MRTSPLDFETLKNRNFDKKSKMKIYSTFIAATIAKPFSELYGPEYDSVQKFWYDSRLLGSDKQFLN